MGDHSTSSFGTWQICRSARLSSSAVLHLHVVNASPSSSLLALSAALPREVIMLAIATAALIVLATTAETAYIKYGGSESYKHEDYDSYKSHYADQYYGHKPSYKIQDYSHRPHHNSYEEDYYGGDAYSEEPTSTYESRPTYKQPRYRRSAADEMGVREDQDMAREAQSCVYCSECAHCMKVIGGCDPRYLQETCGKCPPDGQNWLNCGCNSRLWACI